MLIPLEDNARLNVELDHANGVYRVYVRKEFIEENQLNDGTKYQSIVSYPFADGNFVVRVKEGRKSAKFLDAGNKYLEDNQEQIKDFWLKGWYGAMVGIINKMA